MGLGNTSVSDLGRRALAAWTEDLAALVPAVPGLRRRRRRAGRRVGSGGWTVKRAAAPPVPAPADPAGLRRLLGRGPVDIVVEPALGLVKSVSVPAAAAGHLRRV